jgi:hypothetical protein
MEWYKVSSGLSQAVEGALVLTVVCLLVTLLAGGVSLFLTRVAAGVLASVAPG